MFKTFMIALLVVVLMGVALETKFNSDAEVVKIDKEVQEEMPVEKKDNIDKAKEEMERISQELDSEESKILEEKAQLEAEYKAKQAEKDTRLEKITEIRLSF